MCVCNFNSNDADWCDTIPLFASLCCYSTSGDLTVLHVDGQEELLDGDSAIQTIPFDNERGYDATDYRGTRTAVNNAHPPEGSRVRVMVNVPPERLKPAVVVRADGP